MSQEEINLKGSTCLKRRSISLSLSDGSVSSINKSPSSKEIILAPSVVNASLILAPNSPILNQFSLADLTNISADDPSSNNPNFEHIEGSCSENSHASSDGDDFGDFKAVRGVHIPNQYSIQYKPHQFSQGLQNSHVESFPDQKQSLRSVLRLSIISLRNSFVVDPHSGITPFPSSDEDVDSSILYERYVPENFAQYESFSIFWQKRCENSSLKALNQVWNESTTYEKYLLSVGVDLRNSNRLPSFIDCLKLLEPTPFVPKSRNSPTSSFVSSNVQPLSSPQPCGTAVPEFDWSSSGLTNPLEELEAEFLAPSFPSPMLLPPPPLLNPKTQILNKSLEVNQLVENVLTHLPDFSYMCKSTLMFPILRTSET